MSGMFYKCETLISIDFSNFNTSEVNDMSGILSECKSLKNIDFKNFNTLCFINAYHYLQLIYQILILQM